MFYVYFLKSLKNKKVYVGFTEKEPLVRESEHNLGSNQWTKNNKPFKLIYYEKYCCKKDAKTRELFYKTGFGRQIKNAIISILKK